MILPPPSPLTLLTSPLPLPQPYLPSSIPFPSSALLVGRSRSCGDRKQHARRRFSVLNQKKMTKKPLPSPLPSFSSLSSRFSLCCISKTQHSIVYTPWGDAGTQHKQKLDLKKMADSECRPVVMMMEVGGRRKKGRGWRGWSVNVARVIQRTPQH